MMLRIFSLLCLIQGTISASANLAFRDESSRINFANNGGIQLGLFSLPEKILQNGEFSFAADTPDFLTPISPYDYTKLTFQNVTLSGPQCNILYSGVLDNTQTASLLLDNGTIHALDNTPLSFLVRIAAPPSINNHLTGSLKFQNPNPLIFNDIQSTLRINITTNLNQSIDLTQQSMTPSVNPFENGNIILDGDLSLAPGVTVNGYGYINFNGHNFSVGTDDTTWTGTLRFLNASIFEFLGNVRQTGRWIFDGDSSISGNNNILDLTTSGYVYLEKDAVLELNNLVLKGLGSGTIESDPDGSELLLFGVTIVLDSDYTVYSGTWYVNGPVRIITGPYILRFEGDSQLVVDGAAIEYDPLSELDQNNIQFADPDVNRVFVNGGAIRKAKTLQLGDYVIFQDTALDGEVIISPLRRLRVAENAIINGAGFYYQFARNPGQDIVEIAPDAHVHFTNIILRDFPLANTSYASGSKLTLGDYTQLELGASGSLTTTWYVSGQVVLNGNGKTLDFAADGNIVVRPGASILFDNVTLKGLHGYKIRCMDNRGTVSFGSVIWKQDSSFSFTQGALYIAELLDMNGTSTFAYESSHTSTISAYGVWAFEPNMTLLYAPPLARKDLIWMDGNDATLAFNSATLAATTTGMRVTNGTVKIDGLSYIRADGTTDSNGIIFGSTISAQDITLDLGAGAVLDNQRGKFVLRSSL